MLNKPFKTRHLSLLFLLTIVANLSLLQVFLKPAQLVPYGETETLVRVVEPLTEYCLNYLSLYEFFLVFGSFCMAFICATLFVTVSKYGEEEKMSRTLGSPTEKLAHLTKLLIRYKGVDKGNWYLRKIYKPFQSFVMPFFIFVFVADWSLGFWWTLVVFLNWVHLSVGIEAAKNVVKVSEEFGLEAS